MQEKIMLPATTLLPIKYFDSADWNSESLALRISLITIKPLNP